MAIYRSLSFRINFKKLKFNMFETSVLLT